MRIYTSRGGKQPCVMRARRVADPPLFDSEPDPTACPNLTMDRLALPGLHAHACDRSGPIGNWQAAP